MKGFFKNVTSFAKVEVWPVALNPSIPQSLNPSDTCYQCRRYSSLLLIIYTLMRAADINQVKKRWEG